MAALALAAAACGGSSHPPPQPVGVRADVPLYAGLQGHPRPSEADLRLIAQSAGLAVATPRQLRAVAPALLRLRPSIKLYVYVNGGFARSDEGARFPDSWYLRSVSGQKVRSRVFGNYLMDPLEAGWEADVARSCRDALAAVPGLTGCFLDMIGPAPLRPGYVLGGQTPVDPRTGAPFRPSAYLAATGGLARSVEHDIGHPVIANGLESGVHYYKVPTRPLAADVSGLEVEHWMGLNDTQARSVGGWSQNEQMLIDLAARGRTVLVNLHTPSDGAEGWRMYALASFLLAAGPGAYLQVEPPGKSVPSWHDLSPAYRAGLGSPLESHPLIADYLHDGVYRREYANGLVLVNPADASHTVRLGRAYRVGGGAPVRSVTVPARGGLLLTR